MTLPRRTTLRPKIKAKQTLGRLGVTPLPPRTPDPTPMPAPPLLRLLLSTSSYDKDYTTYSTTTTATTATITTATTTTTTTDYKYYESHSYSHPHPHSHDDYCSKAADANQLCVPNSSSKGNNDWIISNSMLPSELHQVEARADSGHNKPKGSSACVCMCMYV